MRKFKSREGYRKWLAYGHMRTKIGKMAKREDESLFAKTPGSQRIKIRGKMHKVIHDTDKRMKRMINIGY